MRRQFGLLVSTALTSVFAVPLVVTLPVLSPPTPDPHPVEASIESVPLNDVDRSSEQREDGEDEAEDEARRTEAEAAGGLAPTPPADPDGELELQALTARRSTEDFSSVAVSWDMPRGEPPAMTVLVRTHSSDGWSSWQALDPVADTIDPTVSTGQRAGTGALWVGDSDGVQARVDLVSGDAPTGLRLELIDPGTSAADAGIGATPAGSAAAVASQPRIYSRASWGADERRVRANPTYMATVQAGVIHHTTDTNNYRSSQVPAMIRADYAYHLSLGWNDIGYNFLVDRYGRIWEGRRGGIAAAVMGAHAGGFNTNTFGVAAIGNLETGRPTSAMISGLAQLFAWKLDINYRDPFGRTVLTAGRFSGSRYSAGRKVSLPVIMGHRDVGYTACPGRYLYPYIHRIRIAAASIMKAEIMNPVLTSISGSMGQGTTVRAGTVTAQYYKLTVVDCYGNAVRTAATGRTSGRTGFTAAWDGRVNGSSARPGVYGLRVDSASSAGPARSWSSEYMVYPPAVPAASAGSVTSGQGGFVAVTPTRLLDTRSGSDLPIGPGGRVDVPVLGEAGIPSTGTTAVVLNVSAVCPSQGTYTRVWPTGQTEPASSNLNTPSRAARTTTVVSSVGADGKVSLAGGGGVTNLVVDVVGYFSTDSASRYTGVPTDRVHDSTWTSGQSKTISLSSIDGVPAAQIDAVVATVTAASPARAGFLWHRSGSSFATVFNYRAGLSEANQVVLPVENGKITMTNGGSTTRIVLDVVGIWTENSAADQQAGAITPVRAMDATLGAGATREVTVVGGSTGVPSGAETVLVNLTIAGGSTPTFLTAWSTGQTRPVRSDVHSAPNDDHAGMAWVPVGSQGKISVRSQAGTHRVIVDILGYATS
jgi:hypothetical protein